MFSKNQNINGMQKNGQLQSSSVNIIGVNTSIEGEIHSDSDIRIDGHVKGSIDTKAKIVIGTTGIVKGDVTCQTADVSGEIQGTLTVSELLSLKSTSNINGDIITGKLVVETNAMFNGNCRMGAIIKDRRDEKKVKLQTEVEPN